MGLLDKILGRETVTATSSGSHLPERKGVTFSPALVQSIQSLGWAWGSYGTIYRKQPAVRACVDFLARNIAQLNPKVYERVGNVDRIEVSDHMLAVRLRNPEPGVTRYRHLYATVADLAVYDRAFWVLDRPLRPRSIARMPPEKMSFRDENGTTVYVGPDGQVIPRDRLVIFHGYSPSGDELGVSPLETLRRILLEEIAAVEHRSNYWRNAARQSGWIERPLEAPPWSKEARERFRTDLESLMSGGKNSGRTGILEEGMTWNASSFSPKESLWVEGRMLTRKEVAITYGIAPSLVGAGDDTKSNLEANHRHHYQDTLGPWLRMLQDDIELQLLPKFEPLDENRTVYVEFNLKEKLKGSFVEEQKAITSAVGVPHMTVNEGRARQNLPRIDEGWADRPVQPLNVMYGGQPAVTIPTDDPGTASLKTKAVPRAALKRRETTADRFTSLLVDYFDRQEASILGAKTKQARWDRELSSDLYLLSSEVAQHNGTLAAEQLDGTYDHSRTLGWLLENSSRTAEGINSTTFEALEAADNPDDIRHVFDVARSDRAKAVGVGLATTIIAFSRYEAAKHSQDADLKPRWKQWVVTHPQSRHPEMNGETVKLGERFSNGARWPGDPVLGADGAAGCQCLLNLGEE